MKITTSRISVAVLLTIAIYLASCTIYQRPKTPGGSPPEVNFPTGHRTIYQEEQTGPGHVPPPPSLTVSPAVPVATSTIETNAAGLPSLASDESREIIKKFTKMYTDKGSPRIAVFLNRSLSDDVREWQSDVRIAAVYEQNDTVQLTEERHDKELITLQSSVASASALAIEKSADSGDRNIAASEVWVWAFEDGFLMPLLESRVKTIDRATIMRLTTSSDKISAQQPIPPKQIEMNALRNQADILVEVLVSRSLSTNYGYEFKASAKEINTGIVLANVTSMRWNSSNRTSQIIIATSDGYIVEHGIALPSVQDVASHLAIDLMNALMRNWS